MKKEIKKSRITLIIERYSRDIRFFCHVAIDTLKVIFVLGSVIVVKTFAQFLGMLDDPIAHNMIIVSEYAAFAVYVLDLLHSMLEHFGLLKFLKQEKS